MDTSVQYMGRTIKSPVIAGSCGKTANTDNIKRLEDAGVGAVILKSLFEEQITQEISNNVWSAQNSGEMIEAYNYIAQHTKHNQLDNYLELIRKAKQSVQIPVIASINCVSANEWLQFAQNIHQAGADGIELNMFIMPSNVNISADEVEQVYENTIQILKRAVPSLPISLKISSYSASLAKLCQKLSWLGISTLSIFNRFIEHDIDVESQTVKPINIFSNETDIYNTIRWTAILSKLVNCPLTAGGGVHKEDDVIKLLLAGANTVQVASALYQDNDFSFITKAQKRLEEWMEKNSYKHLSDFRGRLSIDKNSTVSTFYRVQYMKYYAGIE
ncbi:MAG: dihydroorotate dehydrogenase-like protein [Bacteroidales bacterium]|nr:dihydroorotate dehydrogenase-like protein [Bacteroidales bacterium]